MSLSGRSKAIMAGYRVENCDGGSEADILARWFQGRRRVRPLLGAALVNMPASSGRPPAGRGHVRPSRIQRMMAVNVPGPASLLSREA